MLDLMPPSCPTCRRYACPDASVLPDLIGHLSRYCPAWPRPRLQKNRPTEHPACKRGRLFGENRHFPLRVYSQKHPKW